MTVDPAIRRARRATALVFAVHGAVTGSFAARIPWVAGHVGLDVGHLGIALLMPGVGAMILMPFSGRLAHHFSFRPLVTVTIAVWCAALILPSLPTSLALLCVTLAVFGGTAGLADMAMNAHGALVEKHYGRSVMSSFHGFWSAGVLAGSAVAAGAARANVDARVQFVIEAAILIGVGALAARALIDDDEPEEEVEAPPMFALPSRQVVAIGLVGLCAIFGEMAGTDWSAVYLKRELHGSAGVAALAVSAFAGTMAITRLLGDGVVHRLGPVLTVRIAAVCAVTGAVITVAAPDLAVAIVGFALLGIGVAVVVPLVFAAAGRIGPHPARSIAGVAGVAYATGLIAPGVIGGIASLSSLATSFGVVAVLVGVMGLAAGTLGRA